MNERGLEFKVGLLILVAGAILVGFIFVLGNFSLRPGFEIAVDYDYIGSLQPGAPIKVAGIKVGKVGEIEFRGGALEPGTGRRVQVRVHAWIEDRARESIRGDAEFFINTAGVLGEQYLEIVPGHDYDHPPIAPGAIVFAPAVHNPPRTDLVVARLYEVLEGISTMLREDQGAIRDLLRDSASAVHELNDLLVHDKAEIASLIHEAAGLAHEATGTLSRVNVGLGDGKPLAGLVASADATLQTARGTMTTLTPPAVALLGDATRVTGLLTEPRLERALGAIDKATAVAGQAGALLDNANGMVTDLRAGRGTAGALLAKDEVYADLRELIRDLKRNPWKLFWKE
jgi:phospholipid/cholesterol/gamma-HCH transport system substrate-binding protein